MANIKSAKKRILVAERNRQRNVSVKSAVKTAVKNVIQAIKEDNEEKIKSSLSVLYSRVDRAKSKGIIHKNTGARIKARMTKHANHRTVPVRSR